MTSPRCVVSLPFVLTALLAQPTLAVWGDDLQGGVAMPSYVAAVSCATTFEDDLIVGGRFELAGGVPVTNVARWDGTGWSALGSELVMPDDANPVQALAVHDGALIAGGAFAVATGAPANHVARWNGTAWVPLADVVAPDLSTADDVTCLASFAGALTTASRCQLAIHDARGRLVAVLTDGDLPRGDHAIT